MPVRDIIFGKRRGSVPTPTPVWGPRFIIGTSALLFDSSLTLTIPSPTPSTNVTNATGSIFSTGNINTLSKSAYHGADPAYDGDDINITVSNTLYLMDGDDPILGMPADYTTAAFYLAAALSNPATWGHLILDSTTITIPNGTLTPTVSDISQYSTPVREGDGVSQPYKNYGCVFAWTPAMKSTVQSTISSIVNTAITAKSWGTTVALTDVETTYATNKPFTSQANNPYVDENPTWDGLITPVDKGYPNYPLLTEIETHYFVQAGQRIFKTNIT